MDEDNVPIFVGIGFTVLMLSIFGYFLWPYEITAQVQDKAWKREIQVERWQVNHKESRYSPPQGAFNIYTESRYDGTGTYNCGTETYRDADGNTKTRTKTCTRSKYATWWIYDIWEWTYNRSFVADGSGEDIALYWPNADDINANDPTNPERLGQYIETYTVIFFTKDGKAYFWTTDFQTWDSIHIENTRTIKINNAGAILEVKEVK